MSQLLFSRKGKAVTLTFATAFFFYFTSEMLLRQHLLGKMSSKDLNINKVLTRLPDGIREKVRVRITKGKLKDMIASARTDEQYISARVTLASMETEADLEKTYFEISNRFPNNPESMSSFLYFFRGKSSLKSISMGDYHEFIRRLPEINQYYAWEAGFGKLKGTGGTNREIIDYLRPLLDLEPPFKDYLRLYVELTEASFQEEASSLEALSRKKEEACEKLPTLEQSIAKAMKEKAGK